MMTETISDGVSNAAAEVVARVAASVVEVGTSGGHGAGVIWGADGWIVTSAHVVPRDQADVRLADGRVFPGSVVARDQANDLAVLRVAASGLPAATIGDARSLRVGELVLAVGHPWGMRLAATVGVVSRSLLDGQSGSQRDLVCADILLGPGNSGGPLADARGRVVGINAMVSGGRALAVPGYLAEQLLIGGGQPLVLGVRAMEIPLSPALAAIAVSSGGLLLAEVAAGSLAEQAGLLIGDVLVSVEGRPLGDATLLTRALAANHEASVHIGLLRGGAPMEVVVTPADAVLRAA